jgi:hypothetical protein
LTGGHVRRLLAEAREEELPEAERAQIDAHLVTCQACRSFDLALARNDALVARREPAGRLPQLKAQTSSSPWLGLLRFASAGLVAVVVGASVGLALGQFRESQERQRQPQSTAAAAVIPGALTLAGSSPSAGFGFISTQGNELLVRSETSDAALVDLPNTLPTVAVAPNGRSIAVWLRGDAPNNNNRFTWSLRVLDAIDKTLGPVLLEAVDELPYGQMRWSSDGSGLIVGTQTPVFRSPQRPGPGAHNSWFAVDLPTAAASRVPALESSLTTAVYAWDRQRDLITAGGVVADADQTTYLVVHAGTVRTFTIPPSYSVRAADAYGGALVVAGLASCAGSKVPGTGCLYVEIHDQATFATIATLPSLQANLQQLPGMVFRPRSQDLIVSFIEQNGDVHDELWSDLGRGARRVLATSAAATDRRAVNGIIPRTDGSAVFIVRFDTSGTGRWYGVLASLEDSTQTPFEIRTGGNPLASVVLDPSFANAMAPAPSSTARTGRTAAELATCRQTGYSGTVVGAFTLRAGDLAQQDETRGGATGPHPLRSSFRDYPADTPIVLCFFDGFIAASQPRPIPPATPLPPYDRFAVTVDPSGQARLIVAGYRDRIVVAPQLP